MADAFLHRRSVFDKHKDAYGLKNPIKQRRVARSWDNPITRRKREKSLHTWANSFAGKRHYRKLSRHNALHLHEDNSMEQMSLHETLCASRLKKLGEAYNPSEELWQKRLYDYLKREVNKVDLDYDAEMYTDGNGNKCVAIVGKGDDSGADYLSGYIVRTDDGAVLKYDYFENPDQEMPLRYNSIGMAEVAHELFKRVEPLVSKYESSFDADEPEYDYNEDEYEALCHDDEKHISEVIASRLKDRKFDVTASYELDEEKIKYQVDVSFYFNEVPSQEERDRLEALVETAIDGCEIKWEDSDNEVYSLNKEGELVGRLGSNFKLSNPPKDQDVVGYSYVVTWYADDEAKYKEPPERDEDNAAPKTCVLAYKTANDTYYCKNKAGDWTTHIEDAWEGSGPDSFSDEVRHNFADVVDAPESDLEVVEVEKFEALGSNGGASESLKKNFRFKDPKSDDDLIAIQDIVYEINRRNESQAVAEKIGSELESLMERASRDPKWNEMSDEECASAMYKAAQPILSKITSEQLEEIFRNPGHDHEYFCDAIEYDEEAEESEYRADDLYDFSSIRHESKCEFHSARRMSLREKLEKMGSPEHESAEAGITSRDVQAVAHSAWSTSGATDFKLDIVRLGDHIIIYAKGPNGEDSVGISWHVHIPSELNSYKTPHVEQFADWGGSEREPERTYDAKDLDDLEKFFQDEFAALQETIDVGKEN